MFTLNRLLVVAIAAGALLVANANEALAQVVAPVTRTSTTSRSTSSGFSTSSSFGPSGFQQSSSGFRNTSASQSKSITTPFGSASTSTTSSTARGFNASSGVINGTAFQNFSRGRSASTTTTRTGSGVFAPFVP